VHFYLGAWADVYKQPVMTPDAVKRRIRRRERPAHFGDVGESTYESEDGGLRFMRSVIYARSCHGTAWHPTQKPLAILLPLIPYSVPPGGLVLDPFMGSGSTLLAANSLGVRSIGIEVEERFCEIAAKRLSQQLLNF
jgi:site-specific DNA-methyltransferase (adenine-specific)